MTYPNFPETPKGAEPIYSWPKFSMVGGLIRGFLWLKSEISKGILRITSSSKQNTLYLNSSVNKGDLNLRSPIQLLQ